MREQTTSRRGFYDRTGDGYEVGRYADRHMGDYRAFRNETLAQILQDSGVPRPARILEVGCGTGYVLKADAGDDLADAVKSVVAGHWFVSGSLARATVRGQ